MDQDQKESMLSRAAEAYMQTFHLLWLNGQNFGLVQLILTTAAT